MPRSALDRLFGGGSYNKCNGVFCHPAGRELRCLLGLCCLIPGQAAAEVIDPSVGRAPGCLEVPQGFLRLAGAGPIAAVPIS